MQILLSSIGTSGDVQPILALGLECAPIRPNLKKITGGTVPGKPVLPS